MAKYKLMQDKEEIRFTVAPDFKELDCHSLKDIIKFTGVFKDAEELKEYLNNYSLIKTNKPLSIQYRFGGKDKKLNYGITYQDDLKFFDVTNIIEFLYQNRTNYELLDKLCSHYRNSYVNNFNIHAIRNYLMTLKKVQVALDDESEIVQEFYTAIHDFVIRECYRYDKKTNKRIPNFKGMRDLAMFLSYRTSQDENIKTDNMNNTNEIIEYAKNKQLQEAEKMEIIDENPKTKKKQFPGQMSFVIKNGNLDI